MKATVLTLPARVKDTPLSFLIDSGAERSLIPASFVPTALLTPADVMLSGVGGHRIPVFGQCSLMVSIRDLRREVRVNFVVVQSAAILGADFITHTGLQLDMRARELRDPLTGLTAKLKASPRTFSVKIVQTLPPPLSEFPTVTAPPDYSSPPTNSVEHTIETTGGPVHCKPRVLSPAKYEAAKVEFDRLLDLGIVRPSSSPWSSPLHVVKKADGTWRPCGDYRALNALTKPDRYAIPNIETFHYRLRGASVFSKLDLVKAYYFIPIAAQDVPKTAICTPFGNFEFLRMGFGLRNAASTFQRFIDSIFRDFPFVVTYIDDILVFSDSEEKHDDHLRAVLTRLDSHGLRINPSKCELRRTSVEFLGYSVQSSGIAPSPSKVQVLRDLPPPQNVKDVRRYIGMFGFYQRFLPNFASIVQPLRDIIIEDDFKWDTSHDRAFSDLKTLLLNSVKLDFPSRDAVLTIATDASATSIGACLHQVVEGVSSPLPFSRGSYRARKPDTALSIENYSLFLRLSRNGKTLSMVTQSPFLLTIAQSSVLLTAASIGSPSDSSANFLPSRNMSPILFTWRAKKTLLPTHFQDCLPPVNFRLRQQLSPPSTPRLLLRRLICQQSLANKRNQNVIFQSTNPTPLTIHCSSTAKFRSPTRGQSSRGT